MEISQNRLARDIGVPPRRINEIVHGKRAVTADTALRLAHYFGTSEAFWMGLQADYEWKRRANASETVWIAKCAAVRPDIACFCAKKLLPLKGKVSWAADLAEMRAGRGRSFWSIPAAPR